jgi:hypothetical protein
LWQERPELAVAGKGVQSLSVESIKAVGLVNSAPPGAVEVVADEDEDVEKYGAHATVSGKNVGDELVSVPAVGDLVFKGKFSIPVPLNPDQPIQVKLERVGDYLHGDCGCATMTIRDSDCSGKPHAHKLQPSLPFALTAFKGNPEIKFVAFQLVDMASTMFGSKHPEFGSDWFCKVVWQTPSEPDRAAMRAAATQASTHTALRLAKRSPATAKHYGVTLSDQYPALPGNPTGVTYLKTLLKKHTAATESAQENASRHRRPPPLLVGRTDGRVVPCKEWGDWMVVPVPRAAAAAGHLSGTAGTLKIQVMTLGQDNQTPRMVGQVELLHSRKALTTLISDTDKNRGFGVAGSC